MNILGSIFVFIISGYIAFTNALATQIENILPTSEKAGEEEILTDEMSLLPSIFGNRIPDILLSSAAYQQAALSNAGTSGQTASTPEEALVNVFCTFTTDDLVRTTTGSGFFIDPDGIIMTNAHVAQFLLLEEKPLHLYILPPLLFLFLSTLLNTVPNNVFLLIEEILLKII